MKVVILEDNELKTTEIGTTLKDLQNIVGGLIEIPYIGVLDEKGIDIIINEEGKLIEGMQPEIALVRTSDSRIVDVIYGNCIFASHDDEGNTIGLNEEQINAVYNLIKLGFKSFSLSSAEERRIAVLWI